MASEASPIDAILDLANMASNKTRGTLARCGEVDDGPEPLRHRATRLIVAGLRAVVFSVRPWPPASQALQLNPFDEKPTSRPLVEGPVMR